MSYLPRLILLIVVGLTPHLALGSLAEQTLFKAARNALYAGQQDEFRRLADRLKDYILHPYLEYEALNRNLDSASDREVADFLRRHDALPVSRFIRSKWLKRLVRARNWKTLLAHWSDEIDDTELRCSHARALFNVSGRSEQFYREALELWLVGRSQPKACDPVFAVLYRDGKVGVRQRWQRITLAMEEGQTSLARYLARPFNQRDRDTVARWIAVYRNPAQGLRDSSLNRDSLIHRRIILQGLHRLARQDPALAYTHWKRVRNRYRFDREEAAKVAEEIAVRAARNNLRQAPEWLAELNDGDASLESRERWARIELNEGDWGGLLEAIDRMPTGELEERWRYWQGRALEQRGQQRAAELDFSRVSRGQGYYPFLAADRIDQGYRIEDDTPSVSAFMKRRLLNEHPGFARALELYRVGLISHARREWSHALKGRSRAELHAAAAIANEAGWHDRAIVSAARSKDWNHLEVRFPTPYKSDILRQAQRNRLDPSWIFAVARKESAFMQDVRSHAGALGLMQLMPATARGVSRRLGRGSNPRNADILDPSNNIVLGSAYLKQVLDRFDGHKVLATAAYNAGPHRVDRWLSQRSDMEADIWVDLIPFTETRRYVRGVMEYSTLFDRQLERPIIPLKRRMPAIPDRE